MADRATKERKLVALMVNDLGADAESEMTRMEEEVRSLPDEELDETLAGRLDLPYPIDAEVLDRALARVEEPTRISEQEPPEPSVSNIPKNACADGVIKSFRQPPGRAPPGAVPVRSPLHQSATWVRLTLHLDDERINILAVVRFSQGDGGESLSGPQPARGAELSA